MARSPDEVQQRPLVFVTGPHSAPTEDGVRRNIERAIEATQREVREETGLMIEPVAWLGVHGSLTPDEAGLVQWHFITSYVRARPLSGEPRAGDDALQARWFTPKEIASLPMHPVNQQIALTLLREAAP